MKGESKKSRGSERGGEGFAPGTKTRDYLGGDSTKEPDLQEQGRDRGKGDLQLRRNKKF